MRGKVQCPLGNGCLGGQAKGGKIPLHVLNSEAYRKCLNSKKKGETNKGRPGIDVRGDFGSEEHFSMRQTAAFLVEDMDMDEINYHGDKPRGVLTFDNMKKTR